jgi:type II secretion system protein L
MSDLFLLMLGPAPDAPLRWGVFEGGRLIEGGWSEGDDLAALAAKAQGADKVAALLPGEQVAVRTFPAAPRGGARQQAAARYLMEDELGEAAEALKIAVAADHTPPIALAARGSLVEAWLAAFAAAGFDCDILSADYLALASDGERATIVGERDRVIAAFSGLGASMDRGLFADLAPQLFAEHAGRVAVAGEAALGRCLPDPERADWLGEIDDARLLSIFGDAVLSRPPANFLEAKFLNRKALVAALAPWRRAGLIAASLVAVLMLGVVVDAARAGREADRWSDAAAALHREYFPGEAKGDPVAFARQRLAQGGGEQSFLWFASRFSDALESNEAVQIDRIRFNAARGEFIVSIRSDSDTAIEALKATLAAAGIAAQDSGGYRSAGGVWTGELTARAQ